MTGQKLREGFQHKQEEEEIGQEELRKLKEDQAGAHGSYWSEPSGWSIRKMLPEDLSKAFLLRLPVLMNL